MYIPFNWRFSFSKNVERHSFVLEETTSHNLITGFLRWSRGVVEVLDGRGQLIIMFPHHLCWGWDVSCAWGGDRQKHLEDFHVHGVTSGIGSRCERVTRLLAVVPQIVASIKWDNNTNCVGVLCYLNKITFTKHLTIISDTWGVVSKW